MEVKELESKLGGIEASLKTFIDKHAEEIKANGKASDETKAALQKLGGDWEKTNTQFQELSARVLGVEQKVVAGNGGHLGGADTKTIGKQLVESEQFKSMISNGQRGTGQVKVGSFHKTNVVNATGQNQPLVQSIRVPGVIVPGLQRLTIRDLMPAIPTTGNLIEFVKETAFTNNAAIQANEGDQKAESALTFALSNVAVKTIAHFIPASKQILSDAPALQAYIDSRLLYGLKLKEEGELLNGSGSGAEISGLIANSTTFDTTRTTVATDNYMDVISHALTQVRTGSFFEPDGIILNDADWEHILLSKDTTGRYLAGGPFGNDGQTLWGKTVVHTPSMASGQFLVGAFSLAAAIWDREDATIEISREHSDFFIRNLIAILAEERVALTVFRALALVYGGFPYGS